MFGWSKRERLKRAVEEARLENELAGLRGKIQNAGTSATYPLSDPLAYEKLFGPVRAGVSPEGAMAHAAYYGSIRLISGVIGMLPFCLYQKGTKGHRTLIEGDARAGMIARRPNPRLSASIYWRSIVSDMLSNGNGVSWIERRGAMPVRLHFVPWSRAGIRLDRILDEPTQVYTLTLDDGRVIQAHQDDVLHIPGSPRWEIFRAMSPLTAYAMAVGIGISADAFAKAYFDNGSSPDGYISYPGGISKTEQQSKEIRNHWMSKFGAENRFAGPAVLTDGGEFKEIRINAADAQLLDTRKFSGEDISARVFGVAPILLGYGDKSSNWGTGIEQLTRAFVEFTLGPHLKAIEEEVNYKVIRDEKLVAEFDRDAFIRGDLLARMQAFRTALGGNNGPGVMTQNEVRVRLNLGEVADEAANTLVAWSAPSAQPESAKPTDSAAEDSQEPPAPAPAKSRARARSKRQHP
jgi:HK97 family phage portal protein